MSASAPNEVIYYSSLYRHGVDEKRRVQIPAKWRPADENVAFQLVLWPSQSGSPQDSCLLVFPPVEWESLVQKLKALPLFDPKADTLRKQLGKYSDRVTLDKGGRICLPEAMAKAAGIENEAVLLGMVDRFEIWNPERYEKSNALDEQLSVAAFQQI
jgi:MraZ protein